MPEVESANNYYPFGMLQPGNTYQADGYRFGFNGMENENEWTGATGSHLNFGARIYDSRVARWLSVDPLTSDYPFASSYNFALNTPIQAVDPDGNLVIFVNGLMLDQGLARDNRKVAVNYTDGRGAHTKPNPNYRPYPTNELSTGNSPTYLGQPFSYWNGIDDKFMDVFKDHNSIYVSGSNLFSSEAIDRYNAGMKSGQELIDLIKSREVVLKADETIKLVGHSQGGAHAAGMAYVLKEAYESGIIKNKIEQIYYLAPHQAPEINSPSGIFSVQYMRMSDKVSSKGIVSSGLISGGSNFGRINGVTEFVTLGDMYGGLTGNRGGHDVDTYDEIFFIPSNKYGGVTRNVPSSSRFVLPDIDVPSLFPESKIDNTKVDIPKF